jgi:diguanylate cyclase (GGDEF)-like protein
LGEVFFQTFTYCNLGEMLVNVGEVDEGARYIARSLSLSKENEYISIQVQAMCASARISLLQNDAESALKIVQDIADKYWDALPTHLHGLIELVRADAFTALGRAGEAIASFRKMRAIESGRMYRQLRLQSDLFVTRLEADSRENQQVQRAFDIVREHADKAAQMEHIALHDQLTMLGNRRMLDERLPAYLTRARDQGARLSVVIVDIDHFKAVNDAHGHQTGDQVLRLFASLLQQNTRDTDFVCRIGGEEFVVVLPGLDGTDAFELCERLRMQIERYPWHSLASNLRVTASMGVSSAPEYDMQTLMVRADRQLYEAKRSGRNRVCAH